MSRRDLGACQGQTEEVNSMKRPPFTCRPNRSLSITPSTRPYAHLLLLLHWSESLYYADLMTVEGNPKDLHLNQGDVLRTQPDLNWHWAPYLPTWVSVKVSRCSTITNLSFYNLCIRLFWSHSISWCKKKQIPAHKESSGRTCAAEIWYCWSQELILENNPVRS